MRITILFLFHLLLVCSSAFAESLDRERFKPVLDQAFSAQKTGNHKTAIKLFKKVYFKSEDLKRDALLGLITSFKDSKKWDDAAETLNLEIKKSPFVGEYRLWLAEVYLAAGKFNEALVEIDFTEKILGQAKTVLHIKSVVQQKLGKHREAIETLTVYLSRDKKNYSALADRAESYFQLKLYVDAYKDFQKAYGIRPFDERIISSYVRSAYFSHYHQDVKKIGQKCIQLFPKNGSCFEYLGRSAFFKKDFSKATKFFDSAVTLAPSHVEIRQLLAESLVFSGNIAESDIQFETILNQRPEFEPAMRSWSAFLFQRKNIEKLGIALKLFNKNNPNNIWASVELSKLLWLVGDSEGALERMEIITKKNKSSISKFYYAYFLDLSKKYEKSRLMLSEVTEPSLEIDFHAAISFFKENKLSEAIQHWLKVPADSPLYSKARVNAALALEQQKNMEDRKPATTSSSKISYFINWSTPQL
ncbi:MAG: hypothetical protein A2622_07300 [Bdellovibrionales bacterium RIFCSPHIGHO2_01_FULL_40_29]|nr:MAG: hypothetical protein A2622_07300 [Bdellovibrionales bacterium RIFCSPHIGHO2_01_FULL_40_29]OFZ33198.1 MAG: hypothetical protein A3D17_11480 [Bdellovibrionales bacterium RIFCSPHIGHO2_02_FULL_40_15]